MLCVLKRVIFYMYYTSRLTYIYTYMYFPLRRVFYPLFCSSQDLRALLLIYKVQPPTEFDAYVIRTLTSLKSLATDIKVRLTALLAETTTSPTQSEVRAEPRSESRGSWSASSGGDLSLDKSSESRTSNNHDQQVPNKKIKLSDSSTPSSAPSTGESIITQTFHNISTAETTQLNFTSVTMINT